jgi:hypothetical protein
MHDTERTFDVKADQPPPYRDQVRTCAGRCYRRTSFVDPSLGETNNEHLDGQASNVPLSDRDGEGGPRSWACFVSSVAGRELGLGSADTAGSRAGRRAGIRW